MRILRNSLVGVESNDSIRSRRSPVAKLLQVQIAGRLNDLPVPPRNRLEALEGNRVGQQSIRVNDQSRICLGWTDAGPAEVEIVDYP